jgi:O-antigen ligase
MTMTGTATGSVTATPRRMATIWLLLTINVLGFQPGEGLIIPVPKSIGQVLTMGALVMAFLLALLLNPRVRVRPTVYLMLLSAMAVVAVASSVWLESGIGSLLRCFRLTVFVATLWLICRWWRGDMAFARYHLRALMIVLFTVILGLAKPNSAFSGPGGRLVGAIWPIPAPQVGQYCAIAIGLVVLMWLGGHTAGRSAALVVVPCLTLALLSQTRTALLGLTVALSLALLTSAWSSARARRALAAGVAAAGVIALAFSQVVLTYLQRGQSADELASLTGRQKVWGPLLDRPRTLGEQLFGVGLTDKSYSGLPIDSSWLSVYHELGLIGVGIVVAFLLVLLTTAVLRPPSPARACALFLTVYCIVSSYTEVGLGDASPYLLHLAVATSLLASSSGRRGLGLTPAANRTRQTVYAVPAPRKPSPDATSEAREAVDR